jgi:transposase-like protein
MAMSDDDDSQAKTLKEIIPSPEPSPLLEAERVDVRANIRDGLNALTESQREVMESFADGKTYADIAREKGVSKAAVRQMAERAADQMRPELQARGTIQFMPARPAEQDLERQEQYTPPENKPPSGASILLIIVLALVTLVLLVAIFGRA